MQSCCWERRMKRFVLIVAASIIALSACTKTGSGGSATEQQVQGSQSGIDKSLMDTSVKPGDDFDKYANGTWEKNAQIPADKSNISVFSTINDEAEKRAADVITSLANSNPAQGSDDARVANFYKAYTNTAGIE